MQDYNSTPPILSSLTVLLLIVPTHYILIRHHSTSPGTRHHYTMQCRLMEPIIIQLQMTIQHYQLPPIPPDLTIIDHLLNLLPDDLSQMKKPSSHWQRTWPLLLSALLTIDINSHPDATFEPEPTTHSWLQPNPSTSTDPAS
ncbi:hypothetical protein [Absidia glauca]|uniref:Uncharacterized protein n=1 Tax=Absidia glauca TaxID=4829 RepID=A0A163J3F1_ABSGL|nr:hypothetical protein [Absidia glauca]